MQSKNWIDEVTANLKRLGADGTGRLLHGRGGCFPGLENLNCDFYSGLLWLTHYDKLPSGNLPLEVPAQAFELLRRLIESEPFDSWVESVVYQRRDGGRYRNLPLTTGGAAGSLGNSFYEGQEEGLKYRLQLEGAMHPGIFTDTAAVRRRVRAFFEERSRALPSVTDEREKGRQGLSLLNLFSFTSFISVAAIAGGCERSVNVDMKRNVLKRGEVNHRLNFGETHCARFLAHDVMKSFGKLQKMGPWSLIVIDPPSIQTASFSLQRDYPKLLRRSAGMLEPDGRILACCNDPGIGPQWLEQMIEEAGLSVEERLPLASGYREQDKSRGLKACLVRRAGDL